MSESEANLSDSLHVEYQSPSLPVLSVLQSSSMIPFPGGSPIFQVDRFLLGSPQIPGIGSHILNLWRKAVQTPAKTPLLLYIIHDLNWIKLCQVAASERRTYKGRNKTLTNKIRKITSHTQEEVKGFFQERYLDLSFNFTWQIR